MPRPGRHSPDDPEEKLALEKLAQGNRPDQVKKVVSIKQKNFSYNGKGKQ